MALRQIMLAKKITDAESALEELRGKTEEYDVREKELEKSIAEAKTEEEKRTVETEVEKFTKEREAHDEAIGKAEKEIEALRLQQEQIKEGEKTKRGTKKPMRKRSEAELEEMRNGINEYVKSKGQKREGFTSVDGGALIPEELLEPQMKPEDIVDLREYVNNVEVHSASGKYPVISQSGEIMHTVQELKENPELANPKIEEIDYTIETRRGYIPISQEMIDDADYDVTGLIRKEIKSQGRNTANKDIAGKFKEATPKEVLGVDGLKDLVNKEIKKVYGIRFIISSSLYGELDKLKDKNGRYLLQDSIAAASGKQLLGKEVVVLDDDVIGTKKGDLVGFVGDAKEFATYFDRKRVSVEWVDNQIYGKLLAGIVRYDVQKTDGDAGFYITYKADGTQGN